MTRKAKVTIHPSFPVGEPASGTPKAARALLNGIEARALKRMLEDPAVPGHAKAVEVVDPKSAA